MEPATTSEKNNGLKWPPLVAGTLMRRYQRFLADVRLRNGRIVTAHCPNTGSMTGCCEAGRPVYLSRHHNPRRKLRYTWELIDMPASLVGVNTLVPNRLVACSIAAGQIPELSGYSDLQREVRIGDHSRIDLLLSAPGRRPCYIEIKNCTFVRDGIALFPDAVTSRGRKHLQVLEEKAAAGNRCVIFFFVQRQDARQFQPADSIDPAYGRSLRRAVRNGVEMLAYDVAIDLDGIRLRRPVPCRL
jgi:sugar fermentation stimulation protein A